MSDRDQRRLEERLQRAGIPLAHRGFTWNTLTGYEGDAVAQVRDYADAVIHGQVVESAPMFGMGLLLYGSAGSGKTTLSTTMVQEVLRAATTATWGSETWHHSRQPGHPAHWLPYRDLIDLEKRSWNDSLTEEEQALLESVSFIRGNRDVIRLLVLDDVGHEKRSEWANKYFEGLIRDRHMKAWPTVITTNVTPDQWVEAYGESCASYMHDAFMHVHVGGRDRRVHG